MAVNCDESEPGTFKDRYLIEYDPHQFLEGIAIASIATQCDVAYIFIRGEYHREAKILERAIKEAYENGRLRAAGDLRLAVQARVLRAPRGRGVHLRRGDGADREPGRQARLAADQAAVPGDRGGVPQADGRQQRRDALLRAAHHRARAGVVQVDGHAKSSPGPKLYCMCGHVNKPGVYEDELGITLRVRRSTSTPAALKGGKAKAAICGGICMGVLGPNQLDIKLDFDDVRFRGGCLGLGTAGMIVMNEHTNMVDCAAELRAVLRPRELRPVHALPRGDGWMYKIMNRIVDGGGPGRRPRHAAGAGEDDGHHAGHDDLRPGRRHGVGDADVHQQVLRRVRGGMSRTDAELRRHLDQAGERQRIDADGE